MPRATLEDPIRLLRDDHDAVLRALDEFDATLFDLCGNRPAEAVRQLRDGLEVLASAVEGHQELAESVLLPILRDRLGTQTIETLVADHAQIRHALHRLAKGLAADANLPVSTMHWLAIIVVDRLERHMDRVADMLFDAIACDLPGAESEALARAMHAVFHGRRRAV